MSPHSGEFYSLPIHIYGALHARLFSFSPLFSPFLSFSLFLCGFAGVLLLLSCERGETTGAALAERSGVKRGWKRVKVTARGRRSGQDESDIPIAGLGSPHVILNNVKGPIIPSHLSKPPSSLLPDCWNSSSCTIANALKLFF